MNLETKDPFTIRNIALWTSFWATGSTVIDWSFRNANVYNIGIGTIITFTIFAFVLGTSGPFPIWVLLYSKLTGEKRIEATFLIFKINNSFSEWVKLFDSEFEEQQSAGITPVFRGVNKNDPKEVIAVLQAKPGVIAKYTKVNSEKIIASGQTLGTEKPSVYLPNG